MVGGTGSNDIEVELYSDTKTRPSPDMLAAMVTAQVGDEQAGEDPTTLKLEAMVAELLGKEAALFLPSGTMCNQIALQIHCRPGDAVLADKTAHIIGFEGGGAAATGGVNILPLDGTDGIFDADQARPHIPGPKNRHHPPVRLIEVEQSANLGGGTIWPMETLDGLRALADEKGIAMHMDGARLMNAAVASNLPAADHAARVDSVWIDFSKGLGCPIGAALAGSATFIEEAWRIKQRMGGAMRQSGYLAAAAIYALENNVARMADDHANAKLFADGIADLPGVRLDAATVQTNIVFFRLSDAAKLDAPALAAALMEDGIRIGAFDARTLRAVTHLDVDRAGVERAVAAMRKALG